MTDNLNYLFENIFNSIYIGLLVYYYLYTFNKPIIDKLIVKTNSLEYKQDILHQALGKIRNIIRIDDNLNNEQTAQLKQIQKEINSIKQIFESNRLDYHSDSDAPVHES